MYKEIVSFSVDVLLPNYKIKMHMKMLTWQLELQNKSFIHIHTYATFPEILGLWWLRGEKRVRTVVV